MCLNPKWIYKTGNYKDDNYRGKKGDFYELGTYSKCGSCTVCINEKMNNWVVRNFYEEKAHEKKCFITLTYRDNPYIIVKKDLQDFMKRLRFNLDKTTGEKIRAFSAMEYGELNNRPHAHLIIYGWEDNKPKYLDINNRKNIVYQSELIQNIWKLGRTSYQPFYENEIPYIALYETSQETFKKSYKMTMEKNKQLEKLATKIKNKRQRENLYKELKEQRELLVKEKEKYLQIKERNSWSIALGWEKFFKEFEQNPNNYPFIEYIQDKEFVTPSPWVKKLANMGFPSAIEEMYRREQMIEQSANEKEEKVKNLLKLQDRKKREIMDWNEKKTVIEIL